MCCEKAAAQDELRQYVASSRAQLQQLLQRLHWTEQGVLQHRPIPTTDSLPVEAELPPSCSAPAEHSVQLTTAQLQQLLPQATRLKANTFDDLQANFSAAQKLLIYEHVLSRTPRQRASVEQNANFAQLVAETRRAHRKQRRHRKSKPTLHEEMHQLVELQMQALQQQLLPAIAGEARHSRFELKHRRRSRSRERRGCSSGSRRSERPKQRSRSRSRHRHKGKRKHAKRSRSRSPRSHRRTQYN
ncbi:arginine/serine-rich coiled-coil protein 2 isoform X2 [Drosophila novamexicana]|uniref:arginine/serine-rich coiled-coil protein 2 isoform X2 n=1 Tax=Drosophila novamexicana TaxID=47314 RepID=UPI0011E60205|nr:arginine/serine-rich coiled-coil protein 2 isoform X2 [Drosophila novamexicana]